MRRLYTYIGPNSGAFKRYAPLSRDAGAPLQISATDAIVFFGCTIFVRRVLSLRRSSGNDAHQRSFRHFYCCIQGHARSHCSSTRYKQLPIPLNITTIEQRHLGCEKVQYLEKYVDFGYRLSYAGLAKSDDTNERVCRIG